MSKNHLTSDPATEKPSVFVDQNGEKAQDTQGIPGPLKQLTIIWEQEFESRATCKPASTSDDDLELNVDFYGHQVDKVAGAVAIMLKDGQCPYDAHGERTVLMPRNI